jgi:hypothetical protein
MDSKNWAQNILVLREKLHEQSQLPLVTMRSQSNVFEAITDYLSELDCSEARVKKVFVQLLKAGKVRVRFPKYEERIELLDYGFRSEEPWIQSRIDQCVLLVRDSCEKALKDGQEVTRQIGGNALKPEKSLELTGEKTVFLRERN